MLTVSVPKLRSPGSRTAEIRPGRVETWLSELPQANAEDSLQQMLQVLFVQNRTGLSPVNRLSLMELYLVPVLNIVEALAQSYVTASFPLSERQSSLANATQRLCLELANGYKIVTNDLMLKNGVDNNKAEFVLAVQRSVDVLSRVVTNAYSLYRTAPIGVWRQLHQLYRIAEAHGTLNHPVKDTLEEGEGDGMISIDESYHRALLIGACDPYTLLQGECDRLFKLVRPWLGAVRISPIRTGEKEKRPGFFVVNLSSDRAPVPLINVAYTGLQSEEDEPMRLIDALDVVGEVHASLKTSASGPAVQMFPGADADNAELLFRFGRALGGVNLARRSVRTTEDQEISLCVGMNATHYFANGQRLFDDTTQRTTISPTDSPPSDAESDDSSDSSVDDAQNRGRTQNPATDRWQYTTIHRLFSCKIRDQSAGGLCVDVKGDTNFRVRVGDLVGLQFPGSEQWRVGSIRWLRGNADQVVRLGIQMLAPKLSPVVVKRHDDEDDDAPFLQALLLPDSPHLEQPESLLIPRGTYSRGQKLVLVGPSREPTVVCPIRLLDRTGTYDQLVISPADRRRADALHA